MAALDFPPSPTVGDKYPVSPVAGQPQYTWDGEKWTTTGAQVTSAGPSNNLPLMDATPAVPGVGTQYAREDHVHPTDTSRAADTVVLKRSPQTLTTTEQTDVRKNVYAAPFDAMAYNGMQINGSMEVSQQNGGTAVTANGSYPADGFMLATNGSQVFRVTDVPLGGILPGFTQALQMVATTANASPAAGNFAAVFHAIEGYRFARAAFGYSTAQPITIAFWVYCATTGLFSGALQNYAQNRSYIFSYTINAAATWEYKTITIPGDTAGTWATDNNGGAYVVFAAMAGTTYQNAAGSWVAGNKLGATGTTNLVKNTTDSLLLTGVVVLPGIEAPSAARSALIMRPYDQELITCQRYYQLISSGLNGTSTTASTNLRVRGNFIASMRVAPTATATAPINVDDDFASNFTQSAAAVSIDSVSSSNASARFFLTNFTGLVLNRYYGVTAAGGQIQLDARL